MFNKTILVEDLRFNAALCGAIRTKWWKLIDPFICNKILISNITILFSVALQVQMEKIVFNILSDRIINYAMRWAFNICKYYICRN